MFCRIGICAPFFWLCVSVQGCGFPFRLVYFFVFLVLHFFLFVVFALEKNYYCIVVLGNLENLNTPTAFIFLICQ